MIHADFCWDENNKKHLFEEHLERKLTIEEIESVFKDNKRLEYFDCIGKYVNDEYICLGKSNRNRLLFIAFERKENKTRPFSCRPATKSKLIAIYETNSKNN
ncbi:MAG: BrnT family toxin [Cytophagales bacterium]|nr:MAG: BrnT family toxin [Cytophagales bacterium]